MISSAIPAATARAASHCEELLRRAATPPDLDLEFARFARGFAEQATTQLERLLSIE